MDGAPSGDVARAAPKDAAGLDVPLRGVDDLEEIDLCRGDCQSVSAAPPGPPDDEPGAPEVGEHMGEEAARNVHPRSDPGGTQHLAEGLPPEGDHRPDRVVPAAGQRHAHGDIIGSLAIARHLDVRLAAERLDIPARAHVV